jgi:hypothetical protein
MEVTLVCYRFGAAAQGAAGAAIERRQAPD